MGRFIRAFLIAIIASACMFFSWHFLQIGRQTPALAPETERATLIKVDKTTRQMVLMRGDHAIRTYAVSLGSDPIGHKQREGDGRTPEGRYDVDSRNSRSRFHLALHISYPSAADTASARQRNVPPGGDIMIHGLPNGLGWLGKLHLSRDWTDGCIAVTNDEMREIWSLVPTGTPIEVTR